jgi:uncharacterized cupin superfamily protein
MREPKVVRLDDAEIVKFGPDAHYQPILGDEAGSTPIRTGIQTSQPGYVAPMHSHPYLEVLHILDGTAEAWIEGGEVLRLLGTHVSPQRIVNYRDGGQTDAHGYRVWNE